MYVAFRNMFQVIDADFRVFFTRYFYVYAMKRDTHYIIRLHYELGKKKAGQSWLNYTNPGFYIDTDYNAGLFVYGHPYTIVLQIKGITLKDKLDYLIWNLNDVKINGFVTVRF